jgi:hypothetical protein
MEKFSLTHLKCSDIIKGSDAESAKCEYSDKNKYYISEFIVWKSYARC